MAMNLSILLYLLRCLGTPFAPAPHVASVTFSRELYGLALRNKVVLSYLSRCGVSKRSERYYEYHKSRHERLLDVMCHVCEVLDEHGFSYAVFKTLKPFEEDVADIDIIHLTGDREYWELVRTLENAGYTVMERGFYSTTLMDARHRYVTEVMVDVYREVSAGPFVYLDKRLFLNHVSERNTKGCKVKVLNPVAEMLATIAHSLIKEREVKFLDYFTTLHLLHMMNGDSMTVSADLIRRARLLYGARLFLSIVAYLHRLAYGFVPGKVSKLLELLGGAVDVGDIVVGGEPPYKLDFSVLARILTEKLGDPVFRLSLVRGLKWFASKRSMARLGRALIPLSH